MADLEPARAHARKNKCLGNMLVRYHIPDHVSFSLVHLVGDETHLTLTMDPLTDLSEYLDEAWWEVQDFSRAQTR